MTRKYLPAYPEGLTPLHNSFPGGKKIFPHPHPRNCHIFLANYSTQQTPGQSAHASLFNQSMHCWRSRAHSPGQIIPGSTHRPIRAHIPGQSEHTSLANQRAYCWPIKANIPGQSEHTSLANQSKHSCLANQLRTKIPMRAIPQTKYLLKIYCTDAQNVRGVPFTPTTSSI